MGPWDILAAPLRSLLGTAQHEEQRVVEHSPLHQTRELEDRLGEACAAVHRSADSLEQHIAVIERLADSLAPLTESVTRLTDQLQPLLEIARPLGAAEHEVGKVEHFFGRHHHQSDVADSGSGQPEPPSSTGSGSGS
jgi:hypothetical protein